MSSGLVIVGLGASAGGIRAMKRFFEEMPPASGATFVVILHLSPEHESRLAEVLQASTAMPVTQVRDRVRVEANHVYVIPPSRSLAMVDGHLELTPIRRIEERRAPIDVFFRTLSETHGPEAIGVVMSGTGADGSTGLKRIKENGGLCIVQEPAESEFSDMPRHSIATGLVDYVLPVAEMPARILAFQQHLSRHSVVAEDGSPVTDEQALHDVFSQLRLQTGHDFSNYRRATLLRRIARRMDVTDQTALGGYAEVLRSRPDELQALFKDLLISVTQFFRDPDAFAVVRERVIPMLFAGKRDDDQVRVWVPACATGEEAYSFAMLLHEYAASLPGAPAVQVFATDLDAASVAVGRQGLYTLSDVADLSPERLQRFFTKEGQSYRVRKELREMVLFSQHNIIKDPPFSHLDLASCRNLLIYLNRTAQRRVFELLHFALDPGRILFLGSSESADGAPDLFEPFDKDAGLFQIRAVKSRVGLSGGTADVTRDRSPLVHSALSVAPPPAATQLPAILHQRLLEAYAPPSLVVNEAFDIVHLSTRAGRYLQFTGGSPSLNLLTVVRPELHLELDTALSLAAQQRHPIEAKGLRLRIDEEDVTVDLLVRPVIGEDDSPHCFLVVFDEVTDALAPTVAPGESVDTSDMIRRLEHEMQRLKAQLRTDGYRHEADAEDHKTANEEFQAVIEELRSSTEELETSREELQSLNEELRTVNQELKIKIDEQAQANDDMQNFINSTEIGTLFLDHDSRITLFTPQVRRLFNVIPTDRGRELSDLTSLLDHRELQREIDHVRTTLEPSEREILATDDTWQLVRVHPYRTADHRVDGVVLTFIDITERKRAEARLRQSEDRLRRATEINTVGVIFFDAMGRITDANEPFLRMSGYSRASLQRDALPWNGIARADPQSPSRPVAAELAATGRVAPFEEEFRRPTGEPWWGLVTATWLTPDEGAAFIIDISAKRTAEGLLQRTETRLRLIVDSIADYAIFTMDRRGTIDSWNRGAAQMFGYSEAEIIGQPGAILFVPEDRDRGVDRQELSVVAAGGPISAERWYIRHDGSTFFASGTLASLVDAAGVVIGFVKVARDLTDRKRWEDALQAGHDALETRVLERTADLAAANQSLDVELQHRRMAEAEVRSLLRRIISIQEEERRRIARDLHDHLGQLVAALSLKLAALGASVGGADRESFGDAEGIIERLDRELDFFTWELRPASLDDLGLVIALGNFVHEWSEMFLIPADFQTNGLGQRRLALDVETNLYRIAQEALNNVYKHAHATRVGVILERRGGEAVLIVEDDGRGFVPPTTADKHDRAIGLLGMRERALLAGGTAEIETAPGKGTTVFVRVPMVIADEKDSATS